MNRSMDQSQLERIRTAFLYQGKKLGADPVHAREAGHLLECEILRTQHGEIKSQPIIRFRHDFQEV